MSRVISKYSAAFPAFLPKAAFANALVDPSWKPETGSTTIRMFIAFVGLTLGVAYWAGSRSRSASQFYAAGGGITALQNGLAIAGAYISAASFLGISGLVYLQGYDGLIYSVGSVVGWPIVALLLAEPLRNLGTFTFADAASFRFSQSPIRILAACGVLATVIFYMIAQMVGAGALIHLLFGVDYRLAVGGVGVLTIIYVAFGGMIATTWIQIIKACLLLASASFMAFMIMRRFDFDFEALFAKAVDVHPKHLAIMSPGASFSDPISAISLGLALMFGAAGLPHILMRFFTVADARSARKSVFYATGFIGYFFALTFVIGFGAIALVSTNPDFLDAANDLTAIKGGSNMAAVHLADIVGGNLFLSFFAAAAFATIVAVVSGLMLAGAATVSHDLYAIVMTQGKTSEREEVFVSRVATIALGAIVVALSIAFEKQNVAFLIGLAFAIAASCNFPVLLMSIMWRGMTTKGAVIGGFLGLFSSLAGVILSPAVWVSTLGHTEGSAPFPYENPALFSMALAFGGIWLFSKLDFSARAAKDKAGFDLQFVRSQTGIGASSPVSY